jgi:DnaK suppressor protein
MAQKKNLRKPKKVMKGKKIAKKASKKGATKPLAKNKKVSKATPKQKQNKGKTSKSRFKNQIKDILFQMRKELIDDVSQSIKTETDYLRFDVGDFYDHATSDRARELSLMLTDRERQKLVQIEEALKKIDEGSYGICESCGDEIDEERLIAMPFARLCLSCKIDLETQGKL